MVRVVESFCLKVSVFPQEKVTLIHEPEVHEDPVLIGILKALFSVTFASPVDKQFAEQETATIASSINENIFLNHQLIPAHNY